MLNKEQREAVAKNTKASFALEGRASSEWMEEQTQRWIDGEITVDELKWIVMNKYKKQDSTSTTKKM